MWNSWNIFFYLIVIPLGHRGSFRETHFEVFAENLDGMFEHTVENSVARLFLHRSSEFERDSTTKTFFTPSTMDQTQFRVLS